jgi:hypothetical protein
MPNNAELWPFVRLLYIQIWSLSRNIPNQINQLACWILIATTLNMLALFFYKTVYNFTRNERRFLHSEGAQTTACTFCVSVECNSKAVWRFFYLVSVLEERLVRQFRETFRDKHELLFKSPQLCYLTCFVNIAMAVHWRYKAALKTSKDKTTYCNWSRKVIDPASQFDVIKTLHFNAQWLLRVAPVFFPQSVFVRFE